MSCVGEIVQFLDLTNVPAFIYSRANAETQNDGPNPPSPPMLLTFAVGRLQDENGRRFNFTWYDTPPDTSWLRVGSRVLFDKITVKTIKGDSVESATRIQRAIAMPSYFKGKVVRYRYLRWTRELQCAVDRAKRFIG